MKVLVTGAGAVLGQGIIRCLQASSLKPEIIAMDPSPLAAGLYWVPNRRLIPLARDARYLEVVDAILAAERPDAVLVGTDVELAVFAKHREELERRHATHVIVSSPEVVGIADDKYLTYRFLREHGFDAPASALATEVDRLIEEVGFPLVVKPRVGARSVGMSVVQDRSQLQRAIAGVENPVIQECVGADDTEYTAGALTFDSRCDASIVMRRDLRDGNTFRAYVDRYEELNDFVRRVAAVLGAYGPANFQFRLDEGHPKIFEINARFSGTTPFRRHAGFNEVEMVLRHVLLGEPLRQPEVEPMTILRYYAETVVRAGQEVG